MAALVLMASHTGMTPRIGNTGSISPKPALEPSLSSNRNEGGLAHERQKAHGCQGIADDRLVRGGFWIRERSGGARSAEIVHRRRHRARQYACRDNRSGL